MSDDRRVLVCARVDGRTDPVLWSEGSVFNCVCNRCAELVVIGRAGQAVIASDPYTEIVCMNCIELAELQDADKLGVAPGAIEEAAQYFRDKESH